MIPIEQEDPMRAALRKRMGGLGGDPNQPQYGPVTPGKVGALGGDPTQPEYGPVNPVKVGALGADPTRPEYGPVAVKAPGGLGGDPSQPILGPVKPTLGGPLQGVVPEKGGQQSVGAQAPIFSVAPGLQPGNLDGSAPPLVNDMAGHAAAAAPQMQDVQDVGHDGTTAQGQTRETYRDAWMRSGVHDIAGLRAWVAQNGGQVLSDNGTVRTPFGETLDLLIGARTGNGQAGWTATGGGGGGSAAGGGGAGGGSAPGGAAGSDFQNQIREQLRARIAAGSTPVDENSADIKQPYDAAALSVSRSQDAERKALAERMYASGELGSDALTQGIQQSMERNAVGLGGIKSDLIGRALSAKRQDAQQALALAVQTGDAESARALQLQIAQMDNALRARGLDQNQSQFDDSYGLRVADSQYQRDLDAARAAAGLNF